MDSPAGSSRRSPHSPVGDNRIGPAAILLRCASTALALALAATCIVSGLFVCSLPQSTEVLGNAFSGADNPATPLTHDQLVRAAVATRDYTVGSHDREGLMRVLEDIAQEAGAGGALDALPESAYGLDDTSLSHLDDVYAVISAVLKALGILVIAVVAGGILLGVFAPLRYLGTALLAAGIAVLAVLVPLALWAVWDFNGLFEVFHSLFFAEGTWTFPYDSLLITMYPTGFWIGMGGLWLATAVLLSILALAGGILLRRCGHLRAAAPTGRHA